MGRFLGSASARTFGSSTPSTGGGGGGGGVFTKVKIFSTPGTTTFSVPSTSTNVKVIVVGAGSSYRTNTYCHNSSACCSGVNYPKSCYCMCFTGHLTGAGGGYAEKTFTSSEAIQGKTLTINVGSIGGLSASSVSGVGFTAVTATNATESAYSWSCTNNSTARDASNDNPISVGFSIPVCGYQNNICGYYNKGGTATGGDVNRTGGSGVVIPEFLYDSYLDGITCTAPGGFSGNTSSCWLNPSITCACMPCGQYHTTFGGSQFGGVSLVSCVCYYLCAATTNLCACTTGASTSSRYTFIGRNTKCTNCGYLGSESSLNSIGNCAENQFIKDVPIGVGAQAGTSSDNGRNGYSELVLTENTLSICNTTGGNALCVCYYYTTSGYDYSFGGTGYTCFCMAYAPGCYSSCSSFKGTCGSNSWCYICTGFAFTYYFGTTQSGSPTCMCFPYGLAQCSTPTTCANRTYNMGFINDSSLINPPTEYVIPLSTLLDENGQNISDIKYGSGAGISTSARYGGGGNRLYPNGGSGLVVVLY